MSHIHTKPGQHDHTAGAYIVQLQGDEPRLLLHQHLVLGTLLHFGGHVELDETPWQAVVHEIREESGYATDQLELLQPKERVRHLKGVEQHPVTVAHITHLLKEGHYHSDLQYAFVTQEEPRHERDERESDIIVSFSRDELAESDDPRLPENIRQTGLFIFDTCLKTWDRLPAAAVPKNL